MDVDQGARSIGNGTVVALILSVLLAAASLAAERLSAISGNPGIAIPQTALMVLLLPGLYASTIFGDLRVGAVVNGLFYFGLVKFIYWLATRSRRNAGTARG
jgi:hypothetical protein